VPAGAVIIEQDAPDRDFIVLLAGELEIRRRYVSAGNAEELEMGRLSPGDGAGEFAVLFGTPRQASVRAVEPSTILRIEAERMDELLAWSQRFAEELRDTASLRSRMNQVRQVAPFRQLPLERVRMAFERMQPLAVEAGSIVVREGEKGDRYYLIEAGHAEVWRTDPMTGDAAMVALLGPGDAFGEEALLLGGFRNASVTFTSPGRLLVLAKDDFDQLMRPLLVAEISAGQARNLVEQGEADWLDCRYDIEYDEAHIPGARHLPLDKLRELSATLDPNRSVIVYCRSGRRSAAGAFLLRERGFTAYSLTGGVRDWPYALEGESLGTAGDTAAAASPNRNTASA
jgi:CRP-like cAMP-binding protein